MNLARVARAVLFHSNLKRYLKRIWRRPSETDEHTGRRGYETGHGDFQTVGKGLFIRDEVKDLGVKH